MKRPNRAGARGSAIRGAFMEGCGLCKVVELRMVAKWPEGSL